MLSTTTEIMTRVPRTHALPWQMAGFIVIRSRQLCIADSNHIQSPGAIAEVRLYHSLRHSLSRVVLSDRKLRTSMR